MSEFKRENRYVVLKRRDVARLSHRQKEALREILDEIENMLPPREYVVVESDWPEYETVWALIQAHVEGKPNQIATLQSDLAAARAEVERARSALIQAWYTTWNNTRDAEIARYKREIEQENNDE